MRSRHAARTAVVALIGIVAAAAISAGPATASSPDGQAASIAPTTDGASPNEAGIVRAAKDFSPDDGASAAGLADAAAGASALPMAPDGDGLSLATAAGAEVAVDGSGVLTVSGTAGAQELGIAAVGEPSATEVVDGAFVQQDVAPSTDLVTRAVVGGVQMIAVLADDAAPREIAFELDLPEGATLTPAPDGSIAVMAPIAVQQVLPAESRRIDAAVEAIFGGVEDDDVIAAEQWAALEAIPPAATQTVVEVQRIGTIGSAWAVDANGEAVSTRYEIMGRMLTQVVETDETTAFPVTADPSWWWWVGTSVTCATELATIVFAAAKLTKLAVSLGTLMKKSAALYSFVRNLGGAANAIKKIYCLAKGWVEGNVMKYLTRTQYLAITALSSSALSLLGDALGIGSCISLIREL